MALKTRDVAAKTAAAVEQGEREFALAQDQLSAARDQIDASNALVTEVRSDRELAARPMLSVQRPSTDAPASADLEVVLKNVGLGPAVACRYVERYNDEGRMTFAADVGPNSEVVVRHSEILSDPAARTLLYWVGASRTVRAAPAAIFARDVLGNQYQFLLAYSVIGQLVVDHVEQWWAHLEGGPEWAVSQLVWPNNWRRWARRTVTHPVTGAKTVLVTETIPSDGTEVNSSPTEVVHEHPIKPDDAQ